MLIPGPKKKKKKKVEKNEGLMKSMYFDLTESFVLFKNIIFIFML